MKSMGPKGIKVSASFYIL